MRYGEGMSTPRNPNDRLRDRRLAANLTIDEAWAELRAIIPKRYLPSPSKLQRMETETPEEKWDGIVIVGLARVFGCRISDLSKLVAKEHEMVGDLLASASPWITTRQCEGQLELVA